MGKYKGMMVEFDTKHIHLQNVMAELEENEGILVTNVVHMNIVTVINPILSRLTIMNKAL